MSDQERRLGWHFIDSTRKLRYDDGREVVDGETLSVEGKPECCKFGMHASPEVWQALQYAPGLVLCRVEVWGDLVSQNDKFAGTHRKVLWSIPESVIWPLVVKYAKWCAERAEKHDAAASDAAAYAATAAAASDAAANAAYAAYAATAAAANAATAATAERDAQAVWWADALRSYAR